LTNSKEVVSRRADPNQDRKEDSIEVTDAIISAGGDILWQYQWGEDGPRESLDIMAAFY